MSAIKTVLDRVIEVFMSYHPGIPYDDVYNCILNTHDLDYWITYKNRLTEFNIGKTVRRFYFHPDYREKIGEIIYELYPSKYLDSFILIPETEPDFTGEMYVYTTLGKPLYFSRSYINKLLEPIFDKKEVIKEM